MFGVLIDGLTNVFCDNKAVYKNVVILELILKKKHHSIAYHRCHKAVAAGTVRARWLAVAAGVVAARRHRHSKIVCGDYLV